MITVRAENQPIHMLGVVEPAGLRPGSTGRAPSGVEHPNGEPAGADRVGPRRARQPGDLPAAPTPRARRVLFPRSASHVPNGSFNGA